MCQNPFHFMFVCFLLLFFYVKTHWNPFQRKDAILYDVCVGRAARTHITVSSSIYISLIHFHIVLVVSRLAWEFYHLFLANAERKRFEEDERIELHSNWQLRFGFMRKVANIMNWWHLWYYGCVGCWVRSSWKKKHVHMSCHGGFS